MVSSAINSPLSIIKALSQVSSTSLNIWVESITVLGYNEENKEENVTYSINVGSLFGNRDYNEKDEASNNDIKMNITCYADYLKKYNGRQAA